MDFSIIPMLSSIPVYIILVFYCTHLISNMPFDMIADNEHYLISNASMREFQQMQSCANHHAANEYML